MPTRMGHERVGPELLAFREEDSLACFRSGASVNVKEIEEAKGSLVCVNLGIRI